MQSFLPALALQVESPLIILSEIFGWVYFVSWALSFYPQLYVNWKLKSVEGYHLDYPLLNVTGYLFYSICYTVCFFFKDDNPFNNYGYGTIRIQDLAFAYHGAILAILTQVQCMVYKRGRNKVSIMGYGYTIFAWSSALVIFLMTSVFRFIQPSESFNIMLWCGYMKLGVTLLKYAPLAYWNYKRKSTIGFSIFAIVCDFAGGAFSLGQNVVDLKDGTTPIINPVKFALGAISVCYDLFLMFQHFVLYRKNDQMINEKSILLQESKSLIMDKHRSFDVFSEPPLENKNKKILKYSV